MTVFAHETLTADKFNVSWSVGGVDLETSYRQDVLFGPAPEDESLTFLEWLLTSLSRDGFDYLKIEPRR